MNRGCREGWDPYIIGSTLWQAGYATMKLPATSATAFLKSLPKNEFRYLLEHAEQHFTKPKKVDVTEFEFGLELILDGLEKINLARKSRATRPDQ